MSKLIFRSGAAGAIGVGIGEACALRFAEEGARVAGLDVAQPEPAAWKRVSAAAPAESFHIADVRDEGAIAAAVAAVETGLSLRSLDFFAGSLAPKECSSAGNEPRRTSSA